MRNPNPTSALPISGPVMLPIRKPAEKNPETLPRISLGDNLISSAIADTVNIVEPIPPAPRNSRS
ncbi:Uncharacterised protein [Mycobacteroides abscessus subsp. abscessus]|nr:Uncharacterised protein [Mycobacteroides abscessus subsp. abscessus]